MIVDDDYKYTVGSSNDHWRNFWPVKKVKILRIDQNLSNVTCQKSSQILVKRQITGQFYYCLNKLFTNIAYNITKCYAMPDIES